MSAAASLTDAMAPIGKAFESSHPGISVRFNFGSSGTLEHQIEQGAPVDLFISASQKEMDALQAKSLLAPEKPLIIAKNQLVLVRPRGGKINRWEDLRKAERIAISEPENVPSGRYAKQTLEHRGLWNELKPKLVFGQTVRQTLSFATGGNVDAAIVFATDAFMAKSSVDVVATAVPGKDHKPIVYPAAVIAKTTHPADAAQFLTFLGKPEAQAELKRQGFLGKGD